MDLVVTLLGTDITVTAGNVRYKGTQKAVAQDVFSVVDRVDETVIRGFLVHDTVGDTFEVFIDEWIQDGLDEPYTFPRGGQYELAFYLYQVTVPPNTTDLAGIDHLRWRMIPYPAEE